MAIPNEESSSSGSGDFFGSLLRRISKVTSDAGATILSRNTNSSPDWLSSYMDKAEELRRQRDEEAKRQAAEEAARRKAEEDARKAQAQRDAAAATFRQQETADQQRALREQDPFKAAVTDWASTPQGYGILSAGGAEGVDFGAIQRDPHKFLTENNNFREFNWGLDPENKTTLLRRGVPENILNGLHSYLSTDGGAKNARPIGANPTENPIEAGVTGLTGNRFLGQLAGGMSWAIPVVGPAAAGLRNTGQETATQSILEAAAGAGTAAVLGPGGRALDAVVAKAAGNLTKNALLRLGLRGAAQAGLNVAEDTPVNAAQLAAAGVNPFSPEGRKILAQQALMSAAAGVVVPVGAAGLGKAGRTVNKALESVPAPIREAGRSAALGAGAYATTKAVTGDEDTARAAALSASAISLSPMIYKALQDGRIPASIARPLRNLGGSVIESVDENGKKIDEWYAGGLKKTKITYIGDAAYATVPGRTESVRVGYKGENTNTLLARSRTYWKAWDAAPAEAQAEVGTQLRQQFLTGKAPRAIPEIVPGESALSPQQLAEMDLAAAQPLRSAAANEYLYDPTRERRVLLSDLPPEDRAAALRDLPTDTPPGSPAPRLDLGSTASKGRKYTAADGSRVTTVIIPAGSEYPWRVEVAPPRAASGLPYTEPATSVPGPEGGRPPNLGNRVESSNPQQPTATNHASGIKAELTQMAWGPVEPGNTAYYRKLEEERNAVIADNAKRLQNFQKPLPVPDGDPAMRAREILDLTYGAIPEGTTVRELIDSMNRMAEQDPVTALRNKLASEPGGEARQAPRPNDYGYVERPLEPTPVPESPAAKPPPEPPTPPKPPTTDGADSGGPAPRGPSMTDEGLAGDPAARAFVDEADTFINHAAAQTDSNRLTSRATGPVGAIADPASRFTEQAQRDAHTASTAAANFQRSQFSNVYQQAKLLAPLIGNSLVRHVARGAAEVAAPALAFAAAYLPDGEFGGWQDELLLASGFGVSGVLSQAYKNGKFGSRRWMSYGFKPDIEHTEILPDGTTVTRSAELDARIQSDPTLRLIDQLEHPDWYNLPENVVGALQQFQAARKAEWEATNAALRATGQPEIPWRESNAITHLFTKDSVEAQFGKQGSNPLLQIVTPGNIRPTTIEMQRGLGSTLGAALYQFPKLKPEDFAATLADEARQHAQVRARAVLLKGLEDKGLARFVKEGDTVPAAWVDVPGMPGVKMDPLAADVVNNIFKSVHDTNAVMKTMDTVTNEIRTAMFSTDFSAWTLQGAMLAANHPVTFMTHIHDLVLSSASEKYFQWWAKRNSAAMKEASKAGVNIGREFAGKELEGSLNVAKISAIGQLENAGFGRFLPVARTLSFEANKATEAFLQKVPGARLPVIGDATRLIELVPAAAYATYQLHDGEDIDPLTMGVLLAAGAGAGIARDIYGRKIYNQLSAAEQAKAASRAGKLTNRTGSVINREQLGMSTDQSRNERTLLFRSPAMTRNALTLIGLAFNPGAEGQAARAYLVKSAIFYTGLLTAAKYAFTGETDSFDPTDDKSILNPKSLAKLQVPGVGVLSPSNPLVAAVRYALYQDTPDNQTGFDTSRLNPTTQDFWHDRAHGAERFLTGRTPDVAGAALNPLIEGAADKAAKGDYADVRNKGGVTEANPVGFLTGALKRVTPLVAQQAADAGLLQKTELGDMAAKKFGMQANPNFNSMKETVTNMVATTLGFNAQPESLGSELTRRREEVTQTRFAGKSYYDLNSRDRATVNDALTNDKQYQAIKKAVEDKGQSSASPVDTYFSDQKTVNDSYTQRLKDAAAQVNSGQMTRAQFREYYQEQQRSRRTELDRLEAKYSKVSAERPGTDESVTQYLSRHIQPEDKMVEDYFSLYDQAPGVAGKLDFDKLEILQRQFKDSLSPEKRAYLEERLASFDKPDENPLINEYSDVKGTLKEYWTIRDKVFDAMKRNSQIFSQFKNVDEFNAVMDRMAKQIPGATANDVVSLLGSSIPDFKVYGEVTSQVEKMYRLGNPLAEIGLTQWYDRPPVSRVNYALMEYGRQAPPEYLAGVASGNISNSFKDTLPVVTAISKSGAEPVGGMSLYNYWRKRFRGE